MNTSIFFYTFLLVVLLGSVWAQSTTPTPQEIVQAALTSKNNIKKDFETVKLKRENDFRNKLLNVIAANGEELYKFLEEQLFKPEDNKAIVLIENLKDIPELNCVNRLRDYITNIRNREVKFEYRYCVSSLESSARQIRELLSLAQENVNILSTQAEQKINQCQRVYNVQLNVSRLQSCVLEAQVQIKNVSANLDISLQNFTSKQVVLDLAKCVDKTVAFAKSALNVNYDLIEKCLSTSTSSLGKKAATLVQSYKLNVSSSAVAEATEALAALKTKTAEILVNTKSTRAKVVETLANRNKNKDNIKVSIQASASVSKFEKALLNASLILGRIPDAKPCVDDAQNRFRDNLNAKSDNIRKCLDGVTETISVDAVNTLENSILERQILESEVAVALCLTSSGTVGTNNTAICSALADIAFETFIGSVQQKLDEIDQKANVIASQVASCEKLAASSVQITQIAIKNIFEKCLLTRASYNYTLKVE